MAFRSSRPDLATVWDVLKKLRDNNIDESQLVEQSSNRCPMLDCQQKEEVTDNGAGNGTQTPASVDVLDNRIYSLYAICVPEIEIKYYGLKYHISGSFSSLWVDIEDYIF